MSNKQQQMQKQTLKSLDAACAKTESQPTKKTHDPLPYGGMKVEGQLAAAIVTNTRTTHTVFERVAEMDAIQKEKVADRIASQMCSDVKRLQSMVKNGNTAAEIKASNMVGKKPKSTVTFDEEFVLE
jgi:hypothetical protein